MVAQTPRLRRRILIECDDDLNSIPAHIAAGILRKLCLVADAQNPYAPLHKKHFECGYALHYGKYRIFIRVQPGAIIVTRIAHRKNAYQP